MKIFVQLFLLAFIHISCIGQGYNPELDAKQKQALLETSFTTLDGKTVTISDFKGKVIVLDFWETWCGPCLRLMPTLDKLSKDYSEDFVVLAVSPGWSDTKEDVQKFVSENKYNFTNVMAPVDLSKTLKIAGIPYKVYISAKGEIIKARMGISGDPEVDYKEVEEIILSYKSE